MAVRPIKNPRREDRARGFEETGSGLLAGLGGFLASAVGEDALAQTQVLRRDLDELVGGDVFDRALERELRRRRQAGGDTFTLRAEVRELLFADGVDGDVLIAEVGRGGTTRRWRSGYPSRAASDVDA